METIVLCGRAAAAHEHPRRSATADRRPASASNSGINRELAVLRRAADQLEVRLEIERQRLAAGHNSGTITPLQETYKPSAARK